MARDKNPKIPHDAKNRYKRTTVVSGCRVCIEYDACLIDSEDVDLIDVDGDVTIADIQDRLDQVHSLLRAELAEYADYIEAHR